MTFVSCLGSWVGVAMPYTLSCGGDIHAFLCMIRVPHPQPFQHHTHHNRLWNNEVSPYEGGLVTLGLEAGRDVLPSRVKFKVRGWVADGGMRRLVCRLGGWVVGSLHVPTHPPLPTKPNPPTPPLPTTAPTTTPQLQHRQEESLAAVHLADSAGLAISLAVGVLLVAFRRVSPNRRQEWFGVRACVPVMRIYIILLCVSSSSSIPAGVRSGSGCVIVGCWYAPLSVLAFHMYIGGTQPPTTPHPQTHHTYTTP